MQYVMLVFVLLAVIVLFQSIKLVRQSEVLVIERLGRFNGLAERGLNIIIPFIDSVRNRIDLREQVVDFPPQPVITKDNVGINIDFVVYYSVTDPARYTYEIASPLAAIENLTATTIRNIIGELELDETLTSRDLINSRLRAVLDEATDRWGIRVNRVELKNIDPPADVRESMERMLRAERERREQVTKAEGEQVINEALRASNPTREVVALRALETTAKLAHGQATKIVVPAELAGLSALAQVVKEAAGG